MVIISDIFSVADVIVKATFLLSRLPEKWYKKGSEIEKFKSTLSSLSCSSSLWERQLRLNGLSGNPNFNTILAEAVRLLDAEIDYHEKHRRSWARTLKRRPFPGQLTHLLSNILSLLQAGPDQLPKNIEWRELLTKGFLLDPLPLPFGYDLKYVPLQGTVDKVQRALEDTEGRQVITLHGAPGTGKSSLAKYVALLYQDSVQRSTSCPFDCVQYLFCGQGCGSPYQLQKDLFANLGLRAVLEAYEEGQDRDYDSSSLQSALRRVLGGRRMLIILDDVWREDFEVLAKLICLGTPCKYLLTSQTKDVWPEAWFIHMVRPTRNEALDIFHNHLQRTLSNSQVQVSSSSTHVQVSSSSSHVQGCSSNSHVVGSSSNSHVQGSSSNGHAQGSSSNSRLQGVLSNSHLRTSLSSDHLRGPLRRSRVQGFSSNNHPYLSSNREQTPSQTRDFEDKIIDIIKTLESHPLSLVIVAISMNSDGIIGADQLESLAKDVFAFLDETYSIGNILVFERVYSHSVSTSMMLMVDSLRERERNLLFLIILLNGNSRRRIPGRIPEHLVRFFRRRFCDGNLSQSTFDYISAVSYLEDNSLVQVSRSRRDVAFPSTFSTFSVGLTTQNLRREFIRRKRLPALQDIASSLVGTRGDHLDRSLVNVEDAEQCLAVVFAAAYFDHPFIDDIAIPFQSLTKQTSGDLLPRGLEQVVHPRPISRDVVPRGLKERVDARELVKSTKNLHRKFKIFPAMGLATELLDVEGEELWKRQVHSDARKMIMNIVCRQQLDDESMASLLTIPYSTDAACRIFSLMYQSRYRKDLEHGFHYGQRKTLSTTHPETWRALSNLLYSKKLRLVDHFEGSMSKSIEQMFEFESESAIWAELQKLRQLADQSLDRCFRNAVHRGFLGLHGSRLSFEMLNGLDLQDFLPTILGKLIHDGDDAGASETRYNMWQVMKCVRRDRGYVKTLLKFPASCEQWLSNASLFRRLLRLEEIYEPEHPLLLGVLSGTPEFQAEAARILTGDSWKEEENDFTLWPESYGVGLARFWGNVALLRDLHDTTKLRLEKIAKDWVAKLSEYKNGGNVCYFCSRERCIDVPCRKWISMESVADVTRAVTIIGQLHASSALVTSALEGSRKEWMNSMCSTCVEDRWRFYVRACWGQAKAYQQMEMYAETLLYLDMVQQACDIIERYHLSGEHLRDPLQGDLRLHIVLIKALSKDYEGAMNSLDQYAQGLSPEIARWRDVLCNLHGNRGVLLKLSGEFSQAIQEFDYSLQCLERMTAQRDYWEGDPRVHNFMKCCLLEHRGHAKYLMEDVEGFKLDMEFAKSLRSSKLVLEPISWEFLNTRWTMLSEASLRYSLKQLPVDYH